MAKPKQDAAQTAPAQAEMTLEQLVGQVPDKYDVRTVALDEFGTLDCPPPSKEFVESVRRFGVQEMIIAVEHPESHKLKLVSGRRRVTAARLVGITDLPTKVIQANGNLSTLLTITLNEQRRPNPVSDYNAIMAILKENPTASKQLLAKATGMPIATIEERLKLGLLVPKVFDALQKGLVSVSVAKAMSRMPASIQNTIAAKLDSGGAITASDVDDAKRVRAEQSVALIPDSAFETLPPTETAEQASECDLLFIALRESPLYTESLDTFKALKAGPKKQKLEALVNWWFTQMRPLIDRKEVVPETPETE